MAQEVAYEHSFADDVASCWELEVVVRVTAFQISTVALVDLVRCRGRVLEFALLIDDDDDEVD
jgi:hypothetical protein